MIRFDLDKPIEEYPVVHESQQLTDQDFIVHEIQRFRVSRKRKLMVDGQNYYLGDQDILHRKRQVIGPDGELVDVDNLPNNRILNNQYRKMVIQKTNYLVGNPVVFATDDELYGKLLQPIFNKRFQRLLRNVTQDSLNCGLGWVFVYYNEMGELAFKRLDPVEVIPGWRDAEHTILDYAIRTYEQIEYTNATEERIITKVEIYDGNGITYYELENNKLVACEPWHQTYFTVVDGQGEETGYNWQKMPLIPFRYNLEEMPLIKGIKSLQDGINTILSNFQNNMEEDARNTILVLINYDGQNLGEFRQNLATYGAVKVRNDREYGGGDVKTLTVEVNADNYKAIVDIFKKAIIENAMGYDAKDDRVGANANQMNIQSMYSDIDLDANGMETEYQAAFEELLWFVDAHLANVGLGDYSSEDVRVIFNRDMLINETEIIQNINNSSSVLSEETLIEQHPWVDDPQAELDRKAAEESKRQSAMDMYASSFAPQVPAPVNGGIGNGQAEEQ